MIIVLTTLGVALVIAGVLAMRTLWRPENEQRFNGHWKTIKKLAWLVGVLLALATIIWPVAFGYNVESEGAKYRIIGIPFMVAVFDELGHDYVGWITIPGALANALVWFCAPSILLVLVHKIRRHQAKEP